MRRVLVTGGSGKLGRFVVRALATSFEVKVFDRLAADDGVEYVCGDVLDRPALTAAMDGCDTVVHLAALDEIIDASDTEFFRINVEGTWNVFDIARACGTKKVVQCSSVAAVNIGRDNPPQYLPVDTEHPCDPRTSYGLSKLLGEKIARRFSALGDMEVICLRPCLVMQPDIVYAIAAAAAKADGSAPPPPASHPSWRPVGGPPGGSRAFVDPRDVAQAFHGAVEAKGISWGVFFVTASDIYGALPTVQVIDRALGAVPETGAGDNYGPQSRSTIYDISATHRALDWSPQWNWADVLDEAIATGR
jgi:nucleoside-diphosphate-sugar epimerase